MKSLLIKDTTEEERRKLVEQSLGCSSGACDECMSGLADMYDDYIYGLRELEEINRSFRSGLVRDMKGPERTGCAMGEY